MAALIFVSHPSQTQAVTYTVQRCTSMSAMFFLASALFYLKARMLQQRGGGRAQRAGDSGQWSVVRGRKIVVSGQGSEIRSQRVFQLSAYFGLSIVCGMLAFLSKQNTASLPGVILLVEYLVIDRTWEGWKRKIPWFCLVFTLWSLFVLYVVGFFSGGIEGRGLLEDVSDLMQETEYVSRWSYLCTQFNVLVIYIRLLFLPIGQNLDYLYRYNDTFFDGYTPLALAFLIGIVVIGIWNIKKRPILALGIFWFFITLSVESSVIPISDTLFEHRLYLPMFGLVIIVSYLVFYFLSKRKSWAILVSVIIVLCLGTATYLRNRVWQDKITLWSDVVLKNTQNARGHYNLGNALARQGELKTAVDHYFGAIRLKPDWAEARNNLGLTLAEQGDIKSATNHFVEALRLKPKYADAHYNLGVALYQQGRLDGAVRHLSESLRIKPDRADGHNNLGNALARKGRTTEAVSHYLEALRIDPSFANARHNLEMIKRRAGRAGDAVSK